MKKTTKILIAYGLTITAFLSSGRLVLAQETLNIAPQGQFSQLASFTLPQLVQSLLGIAFVLAVITAIGFFIFGGITWISSGGDKGKMEQARSAITGALVGLVIVFCAWAIIQLIQAFFGVSILESGTPAPIPPTSGPPGCSGPPPEPGCICGGGDFWLCPEVTP